MEFLKDVSKMLDLAGNMQLNLNKYVADNMNLLDKVKDAKMKDFLKNSLIQAQQGKLSSEQFLNGLKTINNGGRNNKHK